LTKLARTEWGQRYDTSTPSLPPCPLLWPVSYIWYLETGLAVWIQSIVAVCIVFGVCFSLCSTVVIICTICFNIKPHYKQSLIVPSNATKFYLSIITCFVGRCSSVGISTRYELTVRGSNPGGGGGRDFSHPSRPTLGPTQPPYTMGTGPSPGVKRPGRDVDHPPPSSAEVKERVEL